MTFLLLFSESKANLFTQPSAFCLTSAPLLCSHQAVEMLRKPAEFYAAWLEIVWDGSCWSNTFIVLMCSGYEWTKKNNNNCCFLLSVAKEFPCSSVQTRLDHHIKFHTYWIHLEQTYISIPWSTNKSHSGLFLSLISDPCWFTEFGDLTRGRIRVTDNTCVSVQNLYLYLYCKMLQLTNY